MQDPRENVSSGESMCAEKSAIKRSYTHHFNINIYETCSRSSLNKIPKTCFISVNIQ